MTPEDPTITDRPASQPPPVEAAAPESAASESSPAPEAKVPDATPGKKGWAKMLALSATGFLVLVVVLAAIYFLIPSPSRDFDDPVDAESRSANTALYATLLAAGINDPFVDVNADRAYVVYVLPNATNPDNQSDVYQRFVLGAAADAAPHTQRLFAFQYAGDVPKTLWSVELADIRAYLAGELDAASLDARISKTAF